MNKREIGRINRLNTLLALARMGYATTRQVAREVWGRCDDSTRKMACRTLRSLEDERLVVTKRSKNNINAEQLAALTITGARLLQAQDGTELPGQRIHARDWLRHEHPHRTACNSVYVALRDFDAWTELEVQNNEAPINIFKFNSENKTLTKIPDVIVEINGKTIWVEVENTCRSSDDLDKMVKFLRCMFHQDNPQVAEVHFIITSDGGKRIGDRLAKKLTHAPDSGYSVIIRDLDRRILENHVKVLLLDHETQTLSAVQFPPNT